MEEIQKYECLYNKFSKDYKNRNVRENAWAKIGEKFALTTIEAEKKYKNIRTSYVRYLKKLKHVPSGSGRDAVPKAGEFADLEWLDQHISHRKSTTNLLNHECDNDEIESQQGEEMNSSSSSSINTTAGDDDTSPDIELDITDSPESSSSIKQTLDSTAEDLEIPPKKKSSGSTSSKTKRPWAASNRQKLESSKDVDLAMIQIAEKLLKESSEKPSENEDDEYMHFARSFAKRLKKLPERAQGYVRIQLEQLMFQAEFGASPQQQYPPTPMHMGYNQSAEYQAQLGHHSGTSDYNLHSL